MNSTDRRSLMKIIDERFSLLEAEMVIRRNELARSIRDRVLRDARANCEEARRRMYPLVEEVRALQNRIETAVAEIEKELNVFPGSYSEQMKWTQKGRSWRLSDIPTITSRPHDPIKVEIEPGWAPLDVEQAIGEELEKLDSEHANGGQSLQARRLQLQEEVLSSGMADEAKKFLEKIPSIEMLVPTPAELEKASDQ